MVNVASVQTLNHELSWESEVFAHPQCLFVNVFSRKIFRDAAIVSIGELSCVYLIIEQIVNVDIVHIPLDALQVYILRLLLLIWTTSHSTIRITALNRLTRGILRRVRLSSSVTLRWSNCLFLLFLFRIILVRFFKPMMRKDLRYG